MINYRRISSYRSYNLLDSQIELTKKCISDLLKIKPKLLLKKFFF